MIPVPSLFLLLGSIKQRWLNGSHTWIFFIYSLFNSFWVGLAFSTCRCSHTVAEGWSSTKNGLQYWRARVGPLEEEIRDWDIYSLNLIKSRYFISLIENYHRLKPGRGQKVFARHSQHMVGFLGGSSMILKGPTQFRMPCDSIRNEHKNVTQSRQTGKSPHWEQGRDPHHMSCTFQNNRNKPWPTKVFRSSNGWKKQKKHPQTSIYVSTFICFINNILIH